MSIFVIPALLDKYSRYYYLYYYHRKRKRPLPRLVYKYYDFSKNKNQEISFKFEIFQDHSRNFLFLLSGILFSIMILLFYFFWVERTEIKLVVL